MKLPRISRVFIYLLLLIPLMIFIPGIQGFFYPSASAYSDVAISHYPNIKLIQDTLCNWGVLPTWTDAILGGYPFLADPLSGIWYPPGFLLWVLPLPFGINLMVLLHLFFGGTGMALFLKANGLSDVSAAMGGICYLLMPKMVAHFAAGHITMIFGLAWLPWLIFFEFKRSNGQAVNLIPGIIVYAMIILADVRVAMYSVLLWTAYRLFLLRHVWVEIQKPIGWIRSITRLLGSLLLPVTIAILITAPFFLPFLEFLSHSKRASLTPTDASVFSLAPDRTIGLLIPDMGGGAEVMVYQGMLSFICLLFVMIHPPLRKKCAFWLSLFIACVVLSMGEHVPLVRNLFYLPGLNLLRVPSRFLFLAFLSMSIMTGFALDDFQVLGKDSRTRYRFCMSAPAFFLVFLSMGIWIINKRFPVEWIWSALFFMIFTALLFAGDRDQWGLQKRMMLILPLLIIDLAGVDRTLFTVRSSESVFAQGEPAAELISRQDGIFRVYSPSYSIPQQTSINHGVELADGINPIQLKSYVDFMCGATGVACPNYSVTLPPFVNGNPGEDNRSAIPDMDMLGILNVEYIASAFSIDESSLELIRVVDRTYVYKNQNSLSRAWVQSSTDGIGNFIHPVISISRRPNYYAIEAEGAGVLVLSVNDYPGWEAKVNGENAEIVKISNLLMAVEIPAGISIVEFHFFPRLLIWGLVLSLLTVSGISVYALRARKK